jgi:uncharacterized lipoprotein YehR (DUF1307 family)
MIRKAISGLLAVLLLLSVVACGGNEATKAPQGSPATSPASSAAA